MMSSVLGGLKVGLQHGCVMRWMFDVKVDDVAQKDAGYAGGNLLR
jgi:hypothetical protein